MRIGTTPTHQFTLPFPVDLVQKVEITYCQSGKEIIKKCNDDCVMEGETISITFTQEDTFKFNWTDGNIEIQVRVLTTGNDVLASRIYEMRPYKCLSEEVL